MAKKTNKDRIISFRLTEEQYAPYAELMEKSGVKSSVFFRELLLSKTPVFKAASLSDDRLLFIYNKSGNNLNQIARKVHRAHLRGIISEALFIKLFNALNAIRDLLLAGVHRAD